MKDETASWWLNLANHFQLGIFYLLIFSLPTQLGKHFWPSWSYVFGQRIDYLSPTLYVTDILIGILFLSTVIKRQIRIHGFLALVVLYLALTIFFSRNPFAGWYFLWKFLEMSFVGWYVCKKARDGRLFRIVGYLLALGIIGESILAFIQFFLHSSVGGLFYFLGERTFTSETPGIANASIHGALLLRPYGTFSHPNVLAGFLLIGMLLTVYLFFSSETSRRREVLASEASSFRLVERDGAIRTITRLVLMITLGIGTLGLFLTLSRTTILLWMFLVIAYAFYKAKNFSKKIGALLIACCIVFTASIFVFFPTLLYRFAPSTFEESAVVREHLMQTSFTIISTHPFFGVGLNNFLSSLPSASLIQPVHNIYLLWIAETGLVGGIILGLFLFKLFEKLKTTWQHSNENEKKALFPLLVTFFSLLTLGMFDHYFLTLQQGQLLFATMIGLVWSKMETAD